MLKSRTYILVKDADEEYPLCPGLQMGKDEVRAMLANDCFTEGTVIRGGRRSENQSTMQVVRNMRKGGVLELWPYRKGREVVKVHR